MLTPEKLNYILDRSRVQRELEDSILKDIVRRIVKTDYVSETAAWQAERAQQAGILYSEIIDEVARATGASRKEIEAMFKAAKAQIFDAGDNPTRAMNRVWQAAMTKTFTTARNLTQTTAITTQWAYIEAADLAHMQITSGAFTYQQAITNAVKRAAKQGGVVRYPTGAKTQLAAAIRRAVLTGINQTAGKLCEMRCDDLDCDLVEVTAHYGARPSHAEWQGGVYSRSGNSTEYESLVDATGYGTGEGLMGWNCAHSMHPFFKGSVRMYDKETLRDMKEHKVTYNGKEMGDYEASQLQRRMERGIRESKNTLTALNEQGKLSPSDEQKAAFAKESVTLKKREAKLKDFCNQTNRRSDTFRTQNMGFDRSVSQKAVWANKKSVANTANGGIIKAKGGRIMNINNIDSPIERRNSGKGQPSAIIHTGRPLNNRQTELLNNLPEYDSRVIVHKKSVNMKDLAALTAETGDEFALFTKGNERLVIRGDSRSVNIGIEEAQGLNEQGYKWSGHTHPGVNHNCMIASPGDHAVLDCFKQKGSVIYNSKGQYRTFESEE